MKQNKNTQGVTKENTQKIEEQIQKLVEAIDKVEDEKLLVTNQLKKALADYHNLEANTNKRLALLYLQSRRKLSEKLIPVLDDLTMAINSKEGLDFNEKTLAWSDGVINILQNLEKSMEEIGLKKFIPQKGTKFDPLFHEALSVVNGETPGIIFDVIQPGYILEDTVIRPSRVVVIKRSN